MEIKRDSIGQAHDAIMEHLIRLWKIEDENEIITEDNERTIESPGMKVHVSKPWQSPLISPALEFGPRSLQKYVDELTSITPITGTIKDFEYTYANRLFDYPMARSKDDEWVGDGRIFIDDEEDYFLGIDQVALSVIERLRRNPTSRRAIAVTWVVEKDISSVEPPCLQFVQFLIRDQRLNLHAVFRSHDMAGGWGPNTYALESFQRMIMNKINLTDIKQGYIETYSVSAHIYTSHDQVRKFRQHLRI